MNLPQDVANQALDAIFWSNSIGDLQEGTYEARVLLRAYSQCLRQLLRAAHWNFARRQASLVLLADATGQTPNVGTQVPIPWTYSYAYPNDSMKMRFIPHSYFPGNTNVPQGNIVPQNAAAPVVSGINVSPWFGAKLRPARWLEGVDTNNVPPAGVQDWTQQGVSPQGRTAIFTNVQNAVGIYTGLMNYPSNWDPLFRAAFVAYLASEVAPGIWANKDRAFGLKLRADQRNVARDKIVTARATDGNEGWANSDFEPDWMKFRRTGAGGYDRGGFGDGPGYYYAGCDDCCGAGNTSAY